MLKKNEVLEILENGGHISINEVYRSATVYSLGGDNLGTCRYDTAERIGKQDGYTDKRLGAWSFTRHIEKANVPAEMIAAQEETEPAQEAAQNEEENEMNKTNLTNREIRAAREALVNAHSANRENGPAATVAALVESLGYDRAREIVALMTAARGTWDARISSDSRAWAASVTSTTESELTDRCIYYCDEIHPAHFEQITQAMQQYQPAQEEPEQDEQQPDEIAVDDLLEDLNTGEYGEYLNDYRDSSEYISDAISEIADNHTSIYYSDIMDFIRDDPDALADVINQGLYDATHGYDLHQHGQAAQFMRIEEDIYKHLETALYLAALHFVKYDLKRETIPGDLADLIEEWAADPGDRMDEIPDRIREYFADQDAEQ